MMLSLLHSDIKRNVWIFRNPENQNETTEIPAWSVEPLEVDGYRWYDYTALKKDVNNGR